ncbi:hypothetical protein [Aurantiacibacter luteus]|uniref:DUF11 domain-containing protein n=1 Tax=Aurantiacibacter luteus TaxID=1581420 RepID=A0A0G9MYB3_9SPHN|nr:hypothetical protein [Aurantiacibacter luteus]KLE35584.1 hypothetical protein AAW00_03995 [Aurantiacibacter luteus]
MNHARLKIGFAFATVIVSGISTPSYAQSVEAGTIIQNTAQATFSSPGGPATVTSNTVELTVDELLDVTLTSLDGGAIAATPGNQTLTFELTNTGNGPEAYSLTANPAVAGNDFDVTIDSIAIDTNNNGVFDPGVDEILTGPAITRSLDAGEAITVFVNVVVPSTVADGDQSTIEMTADAVTGTGSPGDVFPGQGEGGVDAVVGSTGATATAAGSLVAGITTVELVKTQSVLDPFGGTSVVPGSIVTYTITANVTGSGSVADFVITDAFPAGTTYSTGTITLRGASLTDAAGDDAGEADATGIAVDLGTVAAPSSQSVAFKVVVE